MLAILDNHPSLYGIHYESQVFYNDFKSDMIAQFLDWDKECSLARKKRWVEKTPKHLYKISEVLNFFPKSKIIVMIRDGRDVACSWKARKDNFVEGVELWKSSVSVAIDKSRDSRLKIVRLEDLVQEPERYIKEILEFLEEDFDVNILNYHKVERQFFSPEIERQRKNNNLQKHISLRNWQINQPLFENTSRWRKEMNEEEKNMFKEKAHDDLVKFNYATVFEDW